MTFRGYCIGIAAYKVLTLKEFKTLKQTPCREIPITLDQVSFSLYLLPDTLFTVISGKKFILPIQLTLLAFLHTCRCITTSTAAAGRGAGRNCTISAIAWPTDESGAEHPVFRWNPDLYPGNTTIDTQHMQLLNLANEPINCLNLTAGSAFPCCTVPSVNVQNTVNPRNSFFRKQAALRRLLILSITMT